MNGSAYDAVANDYPRLLVLELAISHDDLI